MKTVLLSFLLICLSVNTEAQTNYVRNGDMEQYYNCPAEINNIVYCKYWSNVLDTISDNYWQPEYYNTCGNAYPDLGFHIPDNVAFYQFPHSDSGMGGFHFYYDKTLPAPPSPLPFDYRDYLQGRLYKALSAGKVYCVSFWVNMTESSVYGHNKIGAYLDNGAINSLPLAPGTEITSVTPQVYTNTKITDTANWVKIEGSFVATGKETHITIGNFFTNAAVDTVITNYRHNAQYSYYLVDDIAVVPIDAIAQAGVDRWVELGKQTQIGPVEDSTARGMDCQWYYKGKLVGNGNVITVSASTIKYAVDTYVVVQNVCGKTTRDTMLLRTVGAGMSTFATTENTFSISPNPNSGKLVIARNEAISDASLRGKQSEPLSIKVYDLLGRVVYEQSLILNKAQTPLELNVAKGTYLIRLEDEAGNVQHERLIIE